MSRLIDLSGQTFTRLTVIRRAENSKAGQTRWRCQCKCGTTVIVQAAALKDGHSRSCGCLAVETTTKRSTKHGHANSGRISPTYHSWAGMLARCTDQNHRSFHRYGGRGIKVCKRWHDFANFLTDMGEKPQGRSIERKNTNGNYKPQNCRWATPKEQARNKRSNRLLNIGGKTRTAAEWLERTGINRGTFDDRIAAGWSAERALFTPAGNSSNNAKSRMLTYKGETMCVTDWAKRIGLNAQTIYQRLHRGASAEKALHR